MFVISDRIPVRILAFACGIAWLLAAFATSAAAQSSDQLFPTPVRASEITGTIKPRDIGDGRLTSHFYTFEGQQGDVFINVQTRNFTGDIDIYTTVGVRPLTKIVIYADNPETETGRVIYLRKPERILMRIQGRPPGDEEAAYRIKFAGSFAVSQLDDSSNPAAPKVRDLAETDVTVNSAGTILAIKPKAIPTPTAVAERLDPSEPLKPAPDESVAKVAEPTLTVTDTESTSASSKPVVVVTDPLATSAESAKKRGGTTTPKVRESVATKGQAAAKASRRSTRKVPEKKEDAEKSEEVAASAVEKKEEAPDPMANIRLVIYFRDGGTLERPMTDVLRFSVERAILTVISKNGTIGRYNMLEVLRVSIE